jgi:hypothetical protein
VEATAPNRAYLPAWAFDIIALVMVLTNLLCGDLALEAPILLIQALIWMARKKHC